MKLRKRYQEKKPAGTSKKLSDASKKYSDTSKKLPTVPLITTIRFKLILSFLVPVAFIIFLGVVSYQKAAEGLRNSYEHSTIQTMNMTSEYLRLGIKGVEALSTQYQSDDSIKNYFIGIKKNDTAAYSNTRRNIQNSFTTKKATDDFISDISILSDKDISITTIGKIENNIVAGFYETETAKSVKGAISMVWVGREEYLDEKLGVGPESYSLRLIRSITEANALIVIDIDYKVVKDILTDVELDEAGTIGFVTAEGKEIICGAMEDKSEQVFSGQNFYKEAIASAADSGSDYVDYQGERQLFLYSKVANTGAMVCAIVPNSSIIKQADTIRDITFIIVIIACLIAIVIAALISGGISKIIRYIITKLQKASNGDLTIHLSTKRRDEFLILIHEINATFANMKKLAGQVKELSVEVSEASVNVETTSGSFVKATGDISRAMSEIEQGILQQAGDAQECLKQMDSLSGRITLLSDNTSNINTITEDTRQSIHAGTITTGRLNEQTGATKQITAAIVKEIESLADKSKSIDSIINVIDDISNKTNLLSLNASIEAARAGAAGKGFGVVASEIGHLADQTRASVHDIKSIINSIHENTGNAVETAARAEDIMAQQEDAVKNTIESYRNINASVDQLVNHIKNISDNVSNIEEARVSTLGAIENISAVLEEMAASINNVNQTSENQMVAVETLDRWASNLNKNAEQLVTAVKAFLV